MNKASIAVLGIGNTILGDDGAGVHLARHLEQVWSFTPAVAIHLVETGGLHAADLMAGCETAILLDTMVSAEPPGTVVILDKDALLTQHVAPGLAGHALGVGKAIEFALATGAIPNQLYLVAIVPAVIALTEQLSARVQSAMADYERETLALLRALGVNANHKRGGLHPWCR